MTPPNHHVDITVWRPTQLRSPEGSGFASYIVWYRNAQGSNSYHNGNLYVAGFQNNPPEKLLNYALSMTTAFVRENWFMVEVGSALRAIRMTTQEAVAERLKA